MISSKSYEKEWIDFIAAKLQKRGDPIILEKVIYAFTLLEQLIRAELDFIFKGGTSLLLLSKPPRRFSIDIDIITEMPVEQIPLVLDRVLAMGTFTRWEDDNKRKHSATAPIGHYKFYYKSKTPTLTTEQPILLDVLFSTNLYPALIELPISHDWLHSEGDVLMVKTPTIESIAGDKLTAFAPNTTGILYEKGRPVEIIKQLFDLGFLFDNATDFKLMREAYLRVVSEEIQYRNLSIEWRDALADTFDTCLLLSLRDEKEDKYKHLQTGIKNIVNFILESFRIEEAIICAAKVAYTTRIFLQEENVMQRFPGPEQIADLFIDNPTYGKLNRLQKSNPEAFFYWYHTLDGYIYQTIIELLTHGNCNFM